jgi:FKBP-type peptidyl-prolyl cis-trans isomerase
MPSLFRFWPVYISVLLTAGCDTPVQVQENGENKQVSEQFLRANQYMQLRHQDHIAAFLDRVGWEAEVTPSGLWIVLEKPGTGKRIADNMLVTFAFESTLLSGQPCYEATPKDPKQITIGKGEVESGVEQGLKRLSEGAEAVFFIPPHLGHGNFGDRVKIPGNSTLIYRVQVLKVE